MPLIQRILEEDQSVPEKQRCTAVRMFERLWDEHTYARTYCPVRRYIVSLQRSTAETFVLPEN